MPGSTSPIVVRRIGTNVEIRYRDVPLFHNERARAVLTDLGRLYFDLALQQIAGHISDAAPVGVSGHLAQSFAGSTDGGIEVFGQSFEQLRGRVFSSLPYAIVIDQGRRPGARMPPPEALKLWVEKVLGIDPSESRQVAFLVARSIAKKGIEARHFVEQGLKQAEGDLRHIWQAYGDAIAVALTA